MPPIEAFHSLALFKLLRRYLRHALEPICIIIGARGQCPDEFVRRHHSFYTWPLYTRKAERMERRIVPVRANALHRPVRTQGRIENDDSPCPYSITGVSGHSNM